MSKPHRPLEILIIEDNPGDAFLISEMLHDIGLPLNITVATDGQEGLDIMSGKKTAFRESVPDFVVLDLNLPKVNGFEVLSFMKSKPTLKIVPVVVMTGSLNRDDEKRAREMGVTDYRIKPSSKLDIDETSEWLRNNLTSVTGIERTNVHGKPGDRPHHTKDRHKNGSYSELLPVRGSLNQVIGVLFHKARISSPPGYRLNRRTMSRICTGPEWRQARRCCCKSTARLVRLGR